MKQRTCKGCGDPIGGRADKLFCTESCKSAYHYEQRLHNDESVFRRIDRQIKTNRRVLKGYNKAGMSTVRSEVLQEEGFDPGYYTHTWESSKGTMYYFCYEFGFLPIKKRGVDKYLLVHHQHYMPLP